jgi:flagellar hook protein FlgE
MSFSITALSGLRSATKGLEVASNNIANAQTNGFKSSRANFADIALGNHNTPGLGSYSQSQTQSFTQGTVTQTGNSTDLSINGNGFFILQDKSNPNSNLYTRNGNFAVNKDGFVTDTNNNPLMAYNKQNGIFQNTLSNVNVNMFDKTPKATTTVNYDLNLNAQDQNAPSTDSAGITLSASNLSNLSYQSAPNFATSRNIYDSLGGEHRLTTNYYKAGVDSTNNQSTNWYAQTVMEDYNSATKQWSPSGSQTSGGTPGAQVTGMTFDNNGKLTSYDQKGNSFNATPVAISASGNSAPVSQSWYVDTSSPNSAGITQSINLNSDISKLTQFSGSYNIRGITQDGYNLGAFNNLAISQDGTISANYTNGISHNIAKIPLANFNNNQGLISEGNNNWKQSYDSGEPQISDAQSNGMGDVNSGTLENSNVDISNETVNMIFLQQMYMANSKAISVDKENTDAILRLI